MRVKRRMALLLFMAALLLGIFAAAGNEKEPAQKNASDALLGVEPLAGAEEPVTFRFFVRDPGTAPSKDNPVLQKITELTGVTIEFEFLVGDLEQKVGLMIAGEDYPDAIFAEAGKLIDAGAFLALEDYLPDYPNLYAHYSPHMEKITAPDGHMYIMDLYSVWTKSSPIFDETSAGFYIQKAVLADAGYVVPRTLEEYFALIDAYREKYPQINGYQTIGFEILCDDWRSFGLRNAPQHLMGAGNDGDVYVDPETLTASWYQNTDTAKAYYRKLNEEYHKGTIEAECLVESYEQYISRISTERLLAFLNWLMQPAVQDYLPQARPARDSALSVPNEMRGEEIDL